MNERGMIPFLNGTPAEKSPMSDMLDLSNVSMEEVMEEARRMLELLVEYKELRMMYTCALKTMRTKFEVLDAEFNARYQRNPINFISARVKSNLSIVSKMQRKGLALNVDNMEKEVLDIAGIRIICSYLDDIYQLANALLSQDDVRLLRRKDYIASPKPNGYRSLHLVVSVPVYFASQRKEIPVEVQIRTIAMDFWASLEHQMKYKQEISEQELVMSRLKSCADRIADLDSEMQDIRMQIEAAKDKPSPDDALMQRFAQLNDIV